jgi:hypothetical protein
MAICSFYLRNVFIKQSKFLVVQTTTTTRNICLTASCDSLVKRVDLVQPSKRGSNEASASKIGFIGAGKIAQSIIQALIKKNFVPCEDIHASDTNKEYVDWLKEKCDIFQVNETRLLFFSLSKKEFRTD